jgi:5-methylcytosine-specific restriction endonuclease McrA
MRAIEIGTISCAVVLISSRDFEDADMSPKKTPHDNTAGDRIVEMARRQRTQREKSYRAQALKLYPKKCARCGREFSGENLRELTVHHKDHNHDNNPTDGSNWELLCLYCHDNEHARYQIGDDGNAATPGEESEPTLTHTPFALLRTLLKREP